MNPAKPLFLTLLLSLGSALANPGTETAEKKDSLKALAEVGSNRVIEIFSGKEVLSVATVLSADGYLVTKASDLTTESGRLQVHLGERRIPPRVVEILPSVDLVVLKVPAKDLPHVSRHEPEEAEMGDWLISVGARVREASLGVVSAKTREIKPKKAALGIQMEMPSADSATAGVTIKMVIPNSPAMRCGIRQGDVVKTVAGKPVTNPDEVRAAVTLAAPGSALEIGIERNGRKLAKQAILEDTSILRRDRSAALNGETSIRRVDFPEVIQHDTPLDPKMMGGALFGLDGKFLGINIARVNRFTTFALPVRAFGEALDEVMEEDRAKRRALRASLLSPAGPLGSAKSP